MHGFGGKLLFSPVEIFQSCAQTKDDHWPLTISSFHVAVGTNNWISSATTPCGMKFRLSLLTHPWQVFLSLRLLSIQVECVRKQDFKWLETRIFIPKSLIIFCLSASLGGVRVLEEKSMQIKSQHRQCSKGGSRFPVSRGEIVKWKERH